MNRKQLAIDFAKTLNYPEIEKIILYGSVARDEDSKDSDIDILIIVSNVDDDLKIEDDIYEKTFDTLLKTGESSLYRWLIMNTIKNIHIFLFIKMLKKMVF